MGNIIKIQKVKLQNLKNVRNGEIDIKFDFATFHKANVVGVYGQNGSGKTTMVDAFEILKTLISGRVNSQKLPLTSDQLLHSEEQCASFEFDFLIINDYGEYYVNYYVELMNGEERLYPVVEKLSYRENQKNRRSKVLVFKNRDNIQIRTTPLESMGEKLRVKLMVTNELSARECVSFIFHKDLQTIYEGLLTEIELELIRNMAIDFNRDLHVINNQSIGLLMAKYIVPFSVHLEKRRGFIPYHLEGPALLPEKSFQVLSEVIEQTNTVLSTIIPGLEISIQVISEQMLDDGEDGIRFEFLSKRGERVLPLRTESEGILKIISVLSALIAVFNNPNACVVIDELDSGIFEYLLGEILNVIEEGGKGQLLFTSHNLRVLEVLPIKNLWFTTANEYNRYIQLKGIKSMNNARDVYLRSIQLGGQDEEIYKGTKPFHIKRAFRKAGVKNE